VGEGLQRLPNSGRAEINYHIDKIADRVIIAVMRISSSLNTTFLRGTAKSSAGTASAWLFFIRRTIAGPGFLPGS
jgi:hypothetical protein